MKKRFFSALLCLCLLIGLVPGAVTTAFAAGDYKIGDTVTFAGYEWYIIGTDEEADGGVTAPDGCYTLFAKNSDFGTSDYRGTKDYATSNLAKAMEEIASKLPSADKENIVPCDSVGASGTPASDVLLWPLSEGEVWQVNETMRKFDVAYWLRNSGRNVLPWPTDVFLPGEGEEESAPSEPDPDYPYTGFVVTSDGLQIEGYALPYWNYALRPALYVDQNAFETPQVPETALGEGQLVVFGGQTWYMVGEDGSGMVPGPKGTVTLFQQYQYHSPINYSNVPEERYLESDLQEAMESYGDNLSMADGESDYIVPRTLTQDDGIGSGTGSVVDQPFWPLSKDEAGALIETIRESGSSYWLRTPVDSQKAYLVWTAGEITEGRQTEKHFLRPAFYLDTSDVFYASIVGSKPAAIDDELPTWLGTRDETGTWKYTMYDDSLGLAVAATEAQVTQSGESLSLNYLAASTGEGLYLSCILQRDDEILYKKLVDLSDPNNITGTFSIPFREGFPGNYIGGSLTVSVYVERANDDSHTDFASRPVTFKVYSDNGNARITSLGDVSVISANTGADSEDNQEVELRANDTHIEWKYKGEDDTEWRDLVALSAITGEAGTDGREIQLQVANGSIQWKYDIDTGWTNLLALSDLQGQDGREIELQNNGTAIQWRYVGETEWKDLVDLSAITGGDGREIQLRVDGGYIQWKYSADPDTEWQNLIAVSALQGMKGDKGDKGDPGRDGSDGSDGRDGRDGKDGEDGEDGLTPFIGSNGNWWIGAADTGVPAAGADGAPGRDGVGISGLLINEAGELVITLTDGTENNLGRVTGEDGAGIAGISINEAGELIVTLTDGTELNAGVVPTNGPEMSCLRLLVYLALGMSALSLTGLLVAGGLWYRRRRASRS